MKKTSKKISAFSPKFIADFSNVTDTNSALVSMAISKINANEPITAEELDAVIDDVKNATANAIFNGHNCAVISKNGEVIQYNVEPISTDEVNADSEKKPWYKRIWNKITRKK